MRAVVPPGAARVGDRECGTGHWRPPPKCGLNPKALRCDVHCRGEVDPMRRALLFVQLLLAGCAPAPALLVPTNEPRPSPTIAVVTVPPTAVPSDVRATAVAAAATANASLPARAPATAIPTTERPPNTPVPPTPTAVVFVAAVVVSEPSVPMPAPTARPSTRAFGVTFTGDQGTRFDGYCLRLQPDGSSSSQSWKGTTPATYSLGAAAGVSCAATKVQSRGRTLTVLLTSGGAVLQRGDTDAPNGVVQVAAGV
jgi:hypothetical protein